MLFLTDSDGNILSSNPAFEAFTGERENIKGFFAESNITADIIQRLKSGKGIRPEHVEVKSRGMTEAWCLVAAEIMPKDEQAREQKDSFLFQAFDISERKRLLDSLAAAQKMDALGRLAGGAAHDFNNILTAILGYIKLARVGINSGELVSTELDGIEKAVERAGNLARQLLVFSRGDLPKPSLFNIGVMVTEYQRMLEHTISCKIKTVINVNDDGHNVFADRGKMEQALLNLFMNARDSMPDGGKIYITTAFHRFEEEVASAIGSIPVGKWVSLTVRDEGIGIEQKDIPKIFEPFFSTKAPDDGTGLGLSTTTGIIKQAGGYIDVKSRPELGSSFTVFLPVFQDGAV